MNILNNNFLSPLSMKALLVKIYIINHVTLISYNSFMRNDWPMYSKCTLKIDNLPGKIVPGKSLMAEGGEQSSTGIRSSPST